MTSKRHQTRRDAGSVLLVVVILMSVLITIGATLLLWTGFNVQESRSQSRKMQTLQVARSARSLALHELRDRILPNTPYDQRVDTTFSSTYGGVTDVRYAPLEKEWGSSEAGNTARDHMDNDENGIVDDELPVRYAGGIFRVRIVEWSRTDPIGAPGLDDDRDGTVDEQDGVDGAGENETWGTSTKRHRLFTAVIHAGYGNYQVRMHVVVEALLAPRHKEYGVYAKRDISLEQDTFLDSYNREKGTYGAESALKNGHVGAVRNLTLDSGTRIHGDMNWGDRLFTPGDAFYTVTGDEKPMEARDRMTLPANSFQRDVLDPGGKKMIGEGEYWQAPRTLELGGLVAKKNAIIQFPENSVVTIGDGGLQLDGSSELIVGSGSTIIIEGSWIAGTQCRVYVNGGPSFETPTQIVVQDKFLLKKDSNFIAQNGHVSFQVFQSIVSKGSAFVGTSEQHPERLTVYVGGRWVDDGSTVVDDVGSVQLANDDRIEAVFYVPEGGLSVENDVRIWGGLVAKDIHLKSRTEVHYEESIGRNCKRRFVSCSYQPAVLSSYIIGTAGEEIH